MEGGTSIESEEAASRVCRPRWWRLYINKERCTGCGDAACGNDPGPKRDDGDAPKGGELSGTRAALQGEAEPGCDGRRDSGTYGDGTML